MLKVTNKTFEEIIKSIPEDYLVVDIGGAAAPTRRADFIIDYVPFEKVDMNAIKGPGEQKFNRDSYYCVDICDRKKWPFEDKQFDYSICSHVLEDIRDPLWVCSEIIRVSKSGYIEVPSRLYEQMFGIDSRFFAGASHHRWIIDVVDEKMRFTFKNFYVHSKYLNRTKTCKRNKDDLILKIEWSNDFSFFENWLNSGKEMFEFILNRKISQSRMWLIYRKIGISAGLIAWLKYFKNIFNIKIK